MLLKTKGNPHLLSHSKIGKITRDPNRTDDVRILVVEQWPSSFIDFSPFIAVLTCFAQPEFEIDKPSVYSVGTFDHLQEDDIVGINNDGTIQTLYRVQSRQNFLLFTERCNSNCLMCSQPPKDKDDTSYLYGLYKQLIPLMPKDCVELGITGGEPTLLGERFFDLLHTIKHELPETELHCLTNGRSFAWKNMAHQLATLDSKKLMLGIPLYADHYQAHDYVVQAKNAFDQTMSGLYNLASVSQRIEIRIVLHRLTIPRLVKLAKFIYKNLPFVEHVAFMGLEYQGYTPHNIGKLWIDPSDYMNELTEAVEYLAMMGMNVSIYNSQLCVLPKHLWQFNKKSISDWKNIYLQECAACAIRDECGGLFASCKDVHSRSIKPFLPEEVESF